MAVHGTHAQLACVIEQVRLAPCQGLDYNIRIRLLLCRTMNPWNTGIVNDSTACQDFKFVTVPAAANTYMPSIGVHFSKFCTSCNVLE